jgi:hypothetical protein
LEATGVDPAIARPVARGYSDDLDGTTSAPFDQGTVLVKELDHASTNRSKTRNRNLQRFRHSSNPVSIKPARV